MKYKLGFNVDGQNPGDLVKLFQYVGEARPTSMLIRNNFDLCYTLSMLAPECHVVYRLTTLGTLGSNNTVVRDEDWWRLLDPQWAALHFFYLQNAPFYLHVLNEPNAHGDDLRRLVEWLLVFIQTLEPYNIKVVVGNWSTGFLTDDDIQILLPLLAVASRSNGKVIIGVHEYGFGFLPNSTYGRNPYNLQTGALTHPEDYPTQEQVESLTLPNWLIGQWLYIRKAARQAGLFNVKFLVTEAGWDYLGDYPADLREYLNNLSRPHGYELMAGLRAAQYLWYRLFPGITFNEQAFRELVWLNSIYQNVDLLGVALFAWDHQDRWRSYNFAGLNDLLELLIGYARMVLQGQTEPIESDWVNAPSALVAPIGEYVNVRRSYSTSSPIVDVIRQETEVRILPNKAMISSGLWLPIRWDGKTGYVRKDVVNVDYLENRSAELLETLQEIFVKYNQIHELSIDFYSFLARVYENYRQIR